jgi:hypothetical protein
MVNNAPDTAAPEGSVDVVLDDAVTDVANGVPSASSPAALDWLLADPLPQPTTELAYPPGLHAAELIAQDNKRAQVRLSQEPAPRWIAIADYVEPALLAHASESRQRVLVESDGRGHLCVVGMLQTRIPEVTKLQGRTIEINATDSLTLKSGRAGLRFRADGDVELVGSRISAASRGLLRLVGKALRLN